VSTDSSASIVTRKADHVRICADEKNYTIESTENDFDAIRLVPNALPEVNFAHIDTAVNFGGYRIALPLMISPMSGGTKVARDFNHHVATIAKECRLACGMGSMRVLLRHPELESQFLLKSIVGDIPVIANISAAQLREDAVIGSLLPLCRRIGADMLSVHLNCGQELFQENGDRDFIGMRSAIAQLVKESPIPIIVKETGFGIAPREIAALIECGVEYIDVAGSGGANWIQVEAYRHQHVADSYPNANLFSNWGLSTATIMAALYTSGAAEQCAIIASGGIRDALQIAKSVALGASLTAMALPFARMIVNEGVERAIKFVQQIALDLKTIMLLVGATSITELQKSAVLLRHDIAHAAEQLNNAL